MQASSADLFSDIRVIEEADMEVSEEARTSIVREIWQRRLRTGVWPEAYDMLEFLTAHGLSLERVEYVRGIQSRKPGNSNEPYCISLNWVAFAHLPEGDELFEQLPRLVKEGGARVRLYPPFNSNLGWDDVTIPFSRMLELWQDKDKALLAAELLDSSGPGGLSFSIQPDRTCRILSKIEALKFRRANTFQELVQIGEDYSDRHLLHTLSRFSCFARFSNLAYPNSHGHSHSRWPDDIIG